MNDKLIALALKCGATKRTSAINGEFVGYLITPAQLCAFAEAVIREREREQCDALVPPKGE